MSSPDTQVTAATARPSARPWYRRPWAIALASAVGLLLLGVGCGYWYLSRPDLPEVDTTGLDPAIVEALDKASAEVRRSPQSAKAWGQLGMILVVHDFRTQGEHCLARAESLDPREPRWPYMQALTALVVADADAALPKLKQTVALCGNEPDAPRVRLAEFYLTQSRFDEAELQFRHLLQVNPRHARAHLGLARIAAQRGETRTCLEPLAIAQADKRTRKQALELMAQVQLRMGEEAKAEQTRKAAATLPDDPHWPDPFNDEAIDLQTGKAAWLKRARRFQELGQEAEAFALLRKTVDDYPDADDAWRSLGQFYLKHKNLSAADNALRRACELAPTSHENFYYVGSVRIVQNNMAGAIEWLRQATALKSDFAPAWYNLGNCLYHEKDKTGAIDAYRKAVRLDPNLFLGHLNLGTLLMQDGEDTEALVFARNALALEPADPRAKKLVDSLLARQKR